jgi:hypothetical protein
VDVYYARATMRLGRLIIIMPVSGLGKKVSPTDSGKPLLLETVLRLLLAFVIRLMQFIIRQNHSHASYELPPTAYSDEIHSFII